MNYRDGVLFLFLAAIWGPAYTAIKVGLEHLPPVFFAALRYDVAAVLMVTYCILAVDYWRPTTYRDILTVVTSGVLIIAGYNAFLFTGEQGTSSATAAIIVTLVPVLTTVFASVLLRDEGLSLDGWIGLAVAFGGVTLIIGPSEVGGGSGLLYPGLILIASISISTGTVLTRFIGTTIPNETMTAWSMLVGAVVLHATSFVTGESVAPGSLPLDIIYPLLYLGVVASALAFVIYFSLLERVGAIEINMVAYAAPVFASLTGFILLGEQPTLFTFGGYFLIFVGFIFVQNSRSGIAGKYVDFG
ncbi:MAG: DMT family transporter [Halobacteria archaeon]